MQYTPQRAHDSSGEVVESAIRSRAKIKNDRVTAGGSGALQGAGVIEYPVTADLNVSATVKAVNTSGEVVERKIVEMKIVISGSFDVLKGPRILKITTA